MSAVTEYYGWLLTQGYGKNQLNKFADYARRADRGEISHNKAYRLACKAGFKGGLRKGYSNMTDQEASDRCEPIYETQGAEAFNQCRQELLTGKKGSFGDWMETAREAGWIDTGIGILGGWLQNRQWGGNRRNQGVSPNYNMQLEIQRQQEERRRKRNQAIIIGTIAVIGIGAGIYYASNKK